LCYKSHDKKIQSMRNNFEHIIFKERIFQSDIFGDQYREYFDENSSSAFNNPLFEDIDVLLNSILLKYPNLTTFQKDILVKLFDAFNNIRTQIDPNRLQSFEYCFNNDEELLLYRSTESGLTNIIINPDECVAYSFIGKNTNKRILKFYDSDSDFELLSLYFFSY